MRSRSTGRDGPSSSATRSRRARAVAGVATEALRQLTAWALSELDVLRIELRINVDNEASKRVAQHCGFVREGVLRSMPLKAGVWGALEVWSRLATDP